MRRWKEQRGSSLETSLFQMSPELKTRLSEFGFMGIVPIPQSRSRTIKRGHESARITAQFFADQLNLSLLPLLELRNPDPPRQTGKPRFDRDFSPQPFRITAITALKPSWFNQLREDIGRKSEVRILLVDDLITSGTTLSKAAAALREFLPRIKCWGGSLGYRPRRRDEPEPRWNPAPLLHDPGSSLLPDQSPEAKHRNEAPGVPRPESDPMHLKTR